MFGFQESVYHRVPLVAVPIFGDQVDNARRAVEKGVGVIVPGGKLSLNEDDLHHMIETVIYNAT